MQEQELLDRLEEIPEVEIQNVILKLIFWTNKCY